MISKVINNYTLKGYFSRYMVIMYIISTLQLPPRVYKLMGELKMHKISLRLTHPPLKGAGDGNVNRYNLLLIPS
ncbi:hypothetical protein ASE74_01690 [Pedobacter sp. Leaf216]|nr:hypothetical protein ASE74_01690 [Pedobacter sp. Leaf216]